MEDPGLKEAQELWPKELIHKKSLIELTIFHTPFDSISLLYGPRQIGKTASLKLFLSQLKDSETLIFTDCSTILEKKDLYQHLTQLIQGKTTIVLDEVQEVEGWHLALRTLYSEGRLKNCRVWCTGSEARYLLESGERLPGRKGEGITIFAHPWSFREYMEFFYPEETKKYRDLYFSHVTQDWLNAQCPSWESYWRDYCFTGGFPRVIGEYKKSGFVPDLVWKIYTDWILGSWSKLRTQERSLMAVARRLCDTLNSRVSYESIKKGTDIQSANTIKTLLEIQEDHFSLAMLPRFDPEKQKFLPAKLKKIYPIDPYIARVWSAIGWNVRRLYSESLPSLQLKECAFFLQTFRRREISPVSYLYNDTSKSEIDFYFQNCGFELKSNGNPTPKQREMLKKCPQAFVVKKKHLPLMAYLVGEKRI